MSGCLLKLTAREHGPQELTLSSSQKEKEKEEEEEGSHSQTLSGLVGHGGGWRLEGEATIYQHNQQTRAKNTKPGIVQNPEEVKRNS